MVIIGHSKGGVDAAAALAMHETQLADIVRGRGVLENNVANSNPSITYLEGS